MTAIQLVKLYCAATFFMTLGCALARLIMLGMMTPLLIALLVVLVFVPVVRRCRSDDE